MPPAIHKPDPTPSRVRRGAIGVLSRGDGWLMVRRSTSVARGGYWCFPGGHLEPGETSRRAIVRELAEELGITVTPVRRLGSIRLADSSYILAVWQVHHEDGTIRPNEREIAEVRWLNPAAIRSIQPALPSNEQVLEMLDV